MTPKQLLAIRKRFDAAFVAGRVFPDGSPCGPYIELANDVPALLDEVERLTAEVDRALITLGKIAAHLTPQQMDAIYGRAATPQSK